MNTETGRRLEALMAQAVEASVAHVETGGLPFVGVLATDDGAVSDAGFNLVGETGDPTAHAEIVAMRQVLDHHGRTSLEGTTLLATGEPCALCYRFAAEQQVEAVCFAVDRDTVAGWGFDYRAGYDALGTAQPPIARTALHLPVDRRLEPFTRYAHLHRLDATHQP